MSKNELAEVGTTNLSTADIQKLNKESLALINQIIAENDVAKVKDLTYLFNINQNKKTIARLDSLSNLQDLLVAQFSTRITERPDEISNQELMTGLKIIQDILERGQTQVTGATEKPLIQVNQQNNSINVGGNPLNTLSRDSREKVKNIITSIMSANKLTTEEVNENKVIELSSEVEEAEETKDK